MALRGDQIDAVRPARISLFGRIAKLVEHSWKLNPKFPYASPSDEGAIFFSFRAGKDNLVFDIALHLPNVAGMRFGNVNNEESNAPAILLVKLIEGRNLPPERRSGVAAENQNHRLPLVQHGELNSLTFVQLEQREVGRLISDLKRPGASMHPGRFKRKNQERDRTGHPGHDARESFRRLMHRPPDKSSETDVTDHQADK